MLVVTPQIQIPLDEFQFTYVRSGGPGGQNVNKVSSKAVLRWPVLNSPSLPEEARARFLTKHRNRVTTEGDLVLSSQRYRDAPRNAQDCLDKLREMLLEAATPPKRRRPTRPSKGAIARRRQNKREQSQKKQSRRLPPPD